MKDRLSGYAVILTGHSPSFGEVVHDARHHWHVASSAFHLLYAAGGYSCRLKHLEFVKMLGQWTQSSVEAEKLNAILKLQGLPWLVREAVLRMSIEVLYQVDAEGELESITRLLHTITVKSTFADGSVSVTRMLGFKNVGSFSIRGKVLHTKGVILYEASGSVMSENETTIWHEEGEDEIVIRTVSREGAYDRRLRRQ